MDVFNALHWALAGGGGFPGILTAIVASALLVCFCLDSMDALYVAYSRACLRLENESWLRNNCKDPVFFSNMRAHTTVCSEVEANARVGAFWAALREVSDDAKTYVQPFVIPVAGAVVCLAVVMPLCCLCTQGMGVRHARRLRCLPMHYQSACLKDV